MPEELKLKAVMIEGQCRIDGCERTPIARGLCSKHWAAAKKANSLDALGLLVNQANSHPKHAAPAPDLAGPAAPAPDSGEATPTPAKRSKRGHAGIHVDPAVLGVQAGGRPRSRRDEPTPPQQSGREDSLVRQGESLVLKTPEDAKKVIHDLHARSMFHEEALKRLDDTVRVLYERTPTGEDLGGAHGEGKATIVMRRSEFERRVAMRDALLQVDGRTPDDVFDIQWQTPEIAAEALAVLVAHFRKEAFGGLA